MKVAISTDGNTVSSHFGRCPSFTIVDIEDGEVRGKETIANPGHRPGYLPEFLHELGVNRIVAGGIGQRAMMLFSQHGVETFAGVEGKIDDVITAICNNTLEKGKSLCKPGHGKGYGFDKSECDHGEEHHHLHDHCVQGGRNMKICITSEQGSLDSRIDPRFGRCEYFLFVDTDSLVCEAVKNPNIESMGGAGIQSAQLVAEKEAGAVLTGHVGPNAYQTLEAAGIEVISGISGSVRGVIEQFKTGKLKIATEPNVQSKFGSSEVK